MNVLLTVAYDGASYAGWQIQPRLRTVCGELSAAVSELTGEEAALTGAGRTDAGVHAAAQAASFQTSTAIPVHKLPEAINSRLKGSSIAVRHAMQVPGGFSARRDALAKKYVYVIENSRVASPLLSGRAAHVRGKLDFGAMEECAGILTGTHDFAAFRTLGSSAKTTARSVSTLEVSRSGGLIIIAVQADGFLYNMVRTIAGTLISAGRGKIAAQEVAQALSDGVRRRESFTAPACGLYLVNVLYDGFSTADLPD